MTSSKPLFTDQTSVDSLKLIDRLCVRFEKDWKQKGPVRLEDYLQEVPTPLRNLAFRELLALELDYRQAAGQLSTQATYLERYPEFASVIPLCFTRANSDPLANSQDHSTLSEHQGRGSITETLEKPSIPGYQVFENLGRGGMGVVYRARQLVPPRMVALKMLLPHAGLSRIYLERFRIEAEALARLQHPNIVQVFEVGESNGRPYFTMEYCAGQSLDRKIQDNCLKDCEAADLVRNLALAMEAAHQHQVIHRDLKPANVLLTGTGTPKIGDFGLARLQDRQITVTASDTVLGTPSYMAPEQVRGGSRDIGPACDIYALGAILYECLTGRPPFKGVNSLETLRLVQESEPGPPRKLNPFIPRDLEIICLKCLRKDPAQRYASAGALGTDLAAFLAGDHIQARPPSLVQKTRRVLGRYQTQVILLASLLVLVLGAAVGAVWHFTQMGVVQENEKGARQDAALSESRAYRLSYHDDMKKAALLIRQGQFADLGKLLDRHEPQQGREDLRDFFWYHARQFRCDDPLASQVFQAGSPIESLGYIANGDLFLVRRKHPGQERVILDPQSNRILDSQPTEVNRGFHLWVPLFCPSQDGKILAVASTDNTGTIVRLIDRNRGREMDSIPMPGPLIQLQIANDNQTLIAVTKGTAGRWDLRSKKQIGPLVTFPQNPRTIAISRRGDQFASLDETSSKVVHFWDMEDKAGNRELRFGQEVTCLEYSPDGSRAVVCEKNQTVFIIRCENQAVKTEWVFKDGSEMLDVAFSPDGKQLAVRFENGIRIFDLEEQRLKTVLRRPGSSSGLAYHPGGTILTRANQDGMVDHLPIPPVLPLDIQKPASILQCVARSSKGDLAALFPLKGPIQIIDVTTNALLRSLPSPGGRICEGYFMPGDRSLATLAIDDNAIRLVDATDGRLTAIYQAGPVSLRRFAVSPDGNLLVAADQDETLHFWDRRNGQKLRLPYSPGNVITCLAFAPDGKTLLVGNGNGKGIGMGDLGALDLRYEGELKVEVRNRILLDAEVNCIAFAPEGDRVVVGFNRGLEICELPKSGPLRKRPDLVPKDPYFKKNITKVELAPWGRDLIVVAGEQGTAFRVYDIASWVIRYEFRHMRWGQLIGESTWLPDGRILVATIYHQALLVDPKKGSFECVGSGPLTPVKSLAFFPNRPTLVTAGIKHGVEYRVDLMPPFIGWAFPPKTLTEDHSFRTGAASGLRFWDLPGFHEINTYFPHEECIDPPDRFAISPNGRFLAAGSIDGSIWVWNPLTGKKIDRLHLTDRTRSYVLYSELCSKVGPAKPEFHTETEGIKHLAFSPDARLLIALGNRGTVSLWNTENWERRHLTLHNPNLANWIGFTAEGLIALASGGQIQIIEPQTGERQKTLGSESDPPITACVCLPDERTLITAGPTANLMIWDYQAGISTTFGTDHAAAITALALHPQGKLIASADRAGTVKLWNLASRSEIGTLESNGKMISALAFSSDGEILAAGVDGGLEPGEVLLWRAPRILK